MKRAAEEEDSAKRRRLAAWRAAQQSPSAPAAGDSATRAWLPWEAAAGAKAGAAGVWAQSHSLQKPPPVATPSARLAGVDEVDPLDAFMASTVLPEVQAAEQQEQRKREEHRLRLAEQRAAGKVPPLAAILEDSDSEEEPDVEMQVPANKVKLIIGPGGEKIKFIQRKTKCRVQVRKDEADLNKAFGSGPSAVLPPSRPGGAAEPKQVTIMLFGSASECDAAQQLIAEAMGNKEQKQKQRQKEYDRKKESKWRERQLYHLRHAHDYEALELPMGAARAEVKKAYRQLAKLWHPDKHPDDPETANEKFQLIQNAYDSLMSTEEDQVIQQLGAA
ncbi:hypothetical protein WJX72_001240 [[Myrmecia] bisecta]|uniref:J domain-containing protein n=1 Tax=[Myrmecia] bisecta TaxID=41462 RepID=A0AAW1PS45_9CHLO